MDLTKQLGVIKVALFRSGYGHSANELEKIRFAILLNKYADRRLVPEPGRRVQEHGQGGEALERLHSYLKKENPLSIWLNPPHLGALIGLKNDKYNVDLFEVKPKNLAHNQMDEASVAQMLEHNPHWSTIKSL